ncbi:phospholipase D-like domain-containing protein [Flavobacterium sp. 102]|uniref:phospholipase D-like domain-containing protein n=1 Tax=Flavobacterium sp. 102 TaxID=2135623 RepID=UPI000EB43C28|nr:phospholipase D-like domain-containing protein [Flavobacterium sp. 102]RKS03062.1 phospholipase D-like protein [Flavobacterium sp. 102]
MEIYFENIKERIIDEISSAKFNVFAAVAWMGEKYILNELTNCLLRGVQVEIIINDDQRFHDFKDKYADFEKNGGKIFLYDTKSSLMHNKFCVIDLCTTITGSFNWSYGATFHQENIIIERKNIEVAHQFALQFIKLKQSSTLFSNIRAGNVELSHKVNVKSFSGYSDDVSGKGIFILLEEGNRRGYLSLEAPYGNDTSFIPNEIHGFWKSKIEIESFDSTKNDNIEYYEFICIDPNIIKYIK